MLKFYIIFSFVLAVCFGAPGYAAAATVSVSPASGTFITGSTFDVSIFLDTEGKDVNTVKVSLEFPPDKLQLVSPSLGKSIVGVWMSQPVFDNQRGVIEFMGGIPNGINVSNGLIAKMTFRARGVGRAHLRFGSDSRVLLNDGLGTDDLNNTHNGVYNLVLPLPRGPVVASETHADQGQWYPNSTVVFGWRVDVNISGYSYVLNDLPVDFPDNISEGVRKSVVYKNLSDGVHFFHIKGLRNGIWGGTTHFAVSVDTSPPAVFPIRISPSKKTSSREPIIKFETSDSFSGIERYEIKFISLSPSDLHNTSSNPIFIETTSPYVQGSALDLGSYDVVVRAYDKAGNYREVVERMKIVSVIFEIVAEGGVRIKDAFTIAWIWIFLAAGVVISILGYFAYRIQRWHIAVDLKRARKDLPSQVKDKLEELQKYREKYGKNLVIFFALASSFALLFFGTPVLAQQVELSPPLVTILSKDISNEEIFYVGGKTDAANVEIIIYMQSLQSGETISQRVSSDKNGDWFYRHPKFLASGNYLLWTQSRIGDLVSPPSPQIQMSVEPTAIQFGASRIGYQMLYLVFVIVLLMVVAVLVGFIIFHAHGGRKKHKRFMKEVSEAEESIRRGFAVLRRDIEAELEIVKKARLNKALSEEAKKREAQLLRDLQWAQQYIVKEVWDIEEAEHHD